MHATFQYSGTPGKRHRMRERMWWNVSCSGEQGLACVRWHNLRWAEGEHSIVFCMIALNSLLFVRQPGLLSQLALGSAAGLLLNSSAVTCTPSTTPSTGTADRLNTLRSVHGCRLECPGVVQDGAEYFNTPPAGFIVYDPAIPAQLLDAIHTMERNFTLEATMPHFNLVNFQLRQLRAAFAVATVREPQAAQGSHHTVSLPLPSPCPPPRWPAPIHADSPAHHVVRSQGKSALPTGLPVHLPAQLPYFPCRQTPVQPQITGRAVVLPRMWCGMDRWWAPHDGTIPGSGLELPYMCPADHVLDLEA